MSRAIILAAGNGDRFLNGSKESKLLQPLLGRPLIHRTLQAACAAGITDVTIVLGYRAEQVREAVCACECGPAQVHFAYNFNWQLENGASVLAASSHHLHHRFALLMGDHLFEPRALQQLLEAGADGDDVLVAVDGTPKAPAFADEATKVRLQQGRIAAIGKDVRPFDALDTGMFVAGRSLFGALTASALAGDTTLSGGIRMLAARGLARALDISGAFWRDVDTIADLEEAEAALALAVPVQ